jgi:formate-dependent nitrite reductase membrane component NrfD
VISLVALAATGGLLIWDLEHPERFFLIFTRPHWRSWLVRGAFIIAGFSLALVAHVSAGLLGGAAAGSATGQIAWAGAPLAALAAVYTAYLFAQAKARDLWQNPLLPPHLLVQALLAGGAVLLVVPAAGEPGLAEGARWIVALAGLVHVAMVLGELTLTHPTAHARLAAHTMVGGRYAPAFWSGLIAVAVASGAAAWPPAIPALPWITSALVLAGLFLHEHAYVQAGQSVPLA